MRPSAVTTPTILAATVALAIATLSRAADCTGTGTGLVPITELGRTSYLGFFDGGLYPGGANAMPIAHHRTGYQRSLRVQRLNAEGELDNAGSIVMLSIGMSNTTQEFCGGNAPACQDISFMGQAAEHPLVDHEGLVIVDGASGGQTAATWDSPADANYNRILNEELTPLGLSEAQVQALWIKVANAGPLVSLPNEGADAFTLVTQLGDIVRAAKQRYPNLQVAFISSRIYAGYASSTLNPEPYAYESAFGVKWVVESQINQMAGQLANPLAGNLNYNTVAPWIAWGPYLWADGLTPRADGLTYECEDFAADGIHPGLGAREKVADQLMAFFLNSPHSRVWFQEAGMYPVGDLTGDARVDFEDLLVLLSEWGPCAPPPNNCTADLDHDHAVGLADLLAILSHWTAF